MAAAYERYTKGGKRYYEIRVSRGRSLPVASMRWYPPEGWGQKSVDRKLVRVAADFERRVKAGEVVSRKERKILEEQRKKKEIQQYTIRDYCEAVYLPEKATSCATSTMEVLQANLRNWVYPSVGECLIAEVTPPMLSSIIIGAQQQGLKISTVSAIYQTLNNLFSTAEFQGVIKVNPVRRVKKPRGRKDDIEPESEKTLTAEQLELIIKEAKNLPLLWQALVRVLIDTGIRRGECAALTWEDVNAETGAVSINKQIVCTKAEGAHVSNTKTGRQRVVYVSGDTLQLLHQLRAEQQAAFATPPTSFIFCVDVVKGLPVHPGTITQRVQALGNKVGIPLHPHLLRHTWASLAVAGGADIVAVAASLGHSKPTMSLQRYTHAMEGSAKAAAEKFQKMLKDE